MAALERIKKMELQAQKMVNYARPRQKAEQRDVVSRYTIAILIGAWA